MRRFFDFVRRERLYLLLLVFVAIVTTMVVTMPDGRAKCSEKKALRSAAAPAVPAVLNDSEKVDKVFAENKYLASVFGMVSLLVVAVFLLGVIIDANLIRYRLSGKTADISTYTLQRINWGIWDVVKVGILFLFFAYVLLITEALLLRYLPIFKNENIRMVINTSIMDVLCVVFIIHFAVVQHKEKLAALGLSVKNFFKNIWYGMVGYIAIIPVLIGIIAVMAFMMSMIKYVPEQQPVVQLFLKEKNTALLLYTSLFAAIVGPIMEELFFRGFMYNAVKKYVGVFWSAMVTALFFAFLHAHLVGFLPIFVLGVALAYLYERTGTLVSSITVHMIHNLSMVALVFLVKQLGVY